jgi:hypothetical protein
MFKTAKMAKSFLKLIFLDTTYELLLVRMSETDRQSDYLVIRMSETHRESDYLVEEHHRRHVEVEHEVLKWGGLKLS